MAIKLDMSKAYNIVEWCFFRKMLIKSGFLREMGGLIMKCISSVSHSFKIKCDICGNITRSRGLRQGDLLSPHLLLICSEGLSSLIGEA